MSRDHTLYCGWVWLLLLTVVYVNPLDMWGILMLTLLDVAISLASSTPNIVFAMADDLGWGDVQYNNGNARTPNLDEMAQSPNTILLQRYYSGGPACSPTRGTVLTGRNHNRYCVWTANRGRNTADFVRPDTRPLPLSEITVAEVMREAGYSTALFGNWHLGDLKPLRVATKSGQCLILDYTGLISGLLLRGLHQHVPSIVVVSMTHLVYKVIILIVHPVPITILTHQLMTLRDGLRPFLVVILPGFIWSLAEKYIIEQVKENKPFFLYLPFHAVHTRYIATEHYKTMYQNYNYTLDQIDYYGTISEMDDVMGKLRKLLKNLGIKNNTLLWFSSDNGPKRNTPGVTNGLHGHKHLLYEGGIRVPGIIEWPDVITNNKVSSFPVVSSDLLPTVRDILSIKPADNRSIDGISILLFLQGKVEKRNQSIYWAYNIRGNFNRKYNISTRGTSIS